MLAECHFENVKFDSVDLEDSKFIDCEMTTLSFNNAHLKNVTFLRHRSIVVLRLRLLVFAGP